MGESGIYMHELGKQADDVALVHCTATARFCQLPISLSCMIWLHWLVQALTRTRSSARMTQAITGFLATPPGVSVLPPLESLFHCRTQGGVHRGSAWLSVCPA